MGSALSDTTIERTPNLHCLFFAVSMSSADMDMDICKFGPQSAFDDVSSLCKRRYSRQSASEFSDLILAAVFGNKLAHVKLSKECVS